MDISSAHQRLRQELQKPDDQVDLAIAALAIAQSAHPQLQFEPYLTQLDDMAAAIAPQLPTERYPLRVLKTINQHLFETMGFRGNQKAYYDPANSYFNHVLDRRLGIPITLSLVYLEVAKRLNFPMVGINFPGHFLIRPLVNEMSVFVDGFHQGEILFKADCQTRLQQIYGAGATLQPQHLTMVTPQDFLARMLTNLKMIFLNQQNPAAALTIVDLLLVVAPDNMREKRDRGLLYFQQGQFLAAFDDLNAYLSAVPEAKDAAQISQLLRRISSEA
ncbi:MAG: transglutaminase-like domain-containing protein [Cyanobacteria bacterium P01_H01_bin.119]